MFTVETNGPDSGDVAEIFTYWHDVTAQTLRSENPGLIKHNPTQPEQDKLIKLVAVVGEKWEACLNKFFFFFFFDSSL